MPGRRSPKFWVHQMALKRTLFVDVRSTFEDSVFHRRQINEDAIAPESTRTNANFGHYDGHGGSE
jgi:hypothetical protein